MAHNEYIGNLIGNSLGIVVEVDQEQGEMAWGEFMRVRVNIDVSKPLLRRTKIMIRSDYPCWVHSTYE